MPQGTVLGTVLFQVMINDLLDEWPDQWTYVDDSTAAESAVPVATVRAVARTLIAGVYIHIFRFCLTSFF